jgi:uncharacterized protein (DUF2147 family)
MRSASVFRASVVAALTAGAVLAGAQARADEKTATGIWQTPDDKTGKVGGWITIHEKDGLFEGAVTKSFPKPGDPVNPTCDACTDDRKGKPVLGMTIMKDLKRDGLDYEGGTILDPRDGSEYSVEMHLSPDGQVLTVRGYLGVSLLGRSQEWKRLPEAEMPKAPVPAKAEHPPKDAKPIKANQKSTPKA